MNFSHMMIQRKLIASLRCDMTTGKGWHCIHLFQRLAKCDNKMFKNTGIKSSKMCPQTDTVIGLTVCVKNV